MHLTYVRDWQLLHIVALKNTFNLDYKEKKKSKYKKCLLEPLHLFF